MIPRVMTFRRIWRNGWHNLMRNKLLTVATIFIIALIFFVFNVILALSFAADSVIDRVGEKIDISAEILPRVADYTVKTLIQTLKDRPEIKEVVYVNKDEALKRFGAKYPNVKQFLENNALENPLPSTLRIVSADVSFSNAILTLLSQPNFSQIIDQEKLLKNQEQKSRNERVLDITLSLRKIGWGLNVLFALVALLILWNSIHLTLHAHQREIAVMQLVGARHAFIRGGFLVEGVLLSVTALLLSVGFSELILNSFVRHLLGLIENESLLLGLNAILVHFEDRWLWTLLWQLLGAAGVGLAASALATEYTFKKTLSFS